MHRKSRLWFCLVLLLAVADGGNNGRRFINQGKHHTEHFESSPTHSTHQTLNNEPMITTSAINELSSTRKSSPDNSKEIIFLEKNPWSEFRNITMNSQLRNIFDKLEGTEINTLVHLFKNWQLPSLSSNTAWEGIEMNFPFMSHTFSEEFDHSKFILQTMMSISRLFEKLGLTNKCSMPTANKIHRTTEEVVKHVFSKKPGVNELSWTNENHPVGKHVRKLSQYGPEVQKGCSPSVSDEVILPHFEQIVGLLDDDLKKLLSYQLAPLTRYLSSNEVSTVEQILPFLLHACIDAFGTTGQSTQHCANDLARLGVKALGEKDIPFALKRKLIRYKRFTDTIKAEEDVLVAESSPPEAIIQDIEKSGSYGGGYGGGGYGGGGHGGGGHGGGGYGGGGYGGYDEPNIIFIPGEGEDISYPLILKFLGILVIGTYVFLGLLVAHTLLSLLLFGLWPSGQKGDRGPPGPKGHLGDKGIKGLKGMKGENGPTGPNGEPGMVGDPGDDGDAGTKGGPGPAGPDGEKGAKGAKGATGAKGPKGEKGEKGNPGDQGAKGEKGIAGRRKRELSLLTPLKSTPDILDAPNLLNYLYRKESFNGKRTTERSAHLIVTTINELWSEFRNPIGCLRCVLFEFLDNQPDESLDSYIVAGFAHVLGDAESLELLQKVSQAKKQMLPVRCRRWKTSCKLEYINDK